MLRLAVRRISSMLHSETSDRSFLSEAEENRFCQIKLAHRRDQFFSGRLLARQLLCHQIGGAISDWSISAESGSKPIIVGHSNLHISLSHSNDYLACALADHPIGIDLECENEKRATNDLIAFICNDTEQGLFHGLSEQQRQSQLIALWTIKEAWLKRHESDFDFSKLRRLAWRICSQNEADLVTWRFDSEKFALSLVSDCATTADVHWPELCAPDKTEWRRFL